MKPNTKYNFDTVQNWIKRNSKYIEQSIPKFQTQKRTIKSEVFLRNTYSEVKYILCSLD